MKKTVFIIQALIYVICISSCSITEKKTIDEEVYGQKPPGTVPEVYEPIFTFIKNVSPVLVDFSIDFSEVLYTIDDTLTNETIIYYTKSNKGRWDKPEVAYFVPNNGIGRNPKFSPDGKYISYALNGDIWIATNTEDKWTVAEKMSDPINTDGYECGISFAKSGSIYLAGNGRIKGNRCDIYCLKNTNTGSDSIRHLGNLNTPTGECMLAISPNERYIVFTRAFHRQGKNVTDLYISFRKNDGHWTVAQKLGPFFNTYDTSYTPRFSNEGKYFFFGQRNWSNPLEDNGSKQYWISTKFFDDMCDFVLGLNEFVE